MATQNIRLAALTQRRAASAVGLFWTPPSSSIRRSSPTLLSARRPQPTPTPALSCDICQLRSFGATAYRRRAAPPPPPAEQKPALSSAPPPPAEPEPEAAAPTLLRPLDETPSGPLADAPRSYGKRTDEFTPTPLSRPIGMPHPPQVGENSGIDLRTLQQRRDDFVNYEKHLQRRQELKRKIIKPYFRDWTNLQFHKGKTFIAPPRLFRADLSLFFPNLVGQRLLAADKAVARHGLSNTTPLLEARAASVVALFSSRWAEEQVASFISPAANPALAELLTQQPQAQLVQINVEENTMRAWLVRRFRGSLRKRVGTRDAEQYMLVTQGISDDIRESIGLLNSKVGYIYLVDRHCRIRWAGSGPSDPEERDSLVKGVRRLLAEAKNERQ